MLLDAPGRWTAWQLWQGPARTHPLAVAHLALRHRSAVAVDALALVASGGGQDGANLRTTVLDGGSPRWAHGTLAHRAALALAWAGLGTEDDLRAAALLYPGLLGHPEAGRLPAVHEQAAAQSLFLAGHREELRRLLPRLGRLERVVRHYLEVDLEHPYLDAGAVGPDPGSAEHRAWEEGLSTLFVERGVAPLRVRPPGDASGGPLFDLLGTDPLPSAAGGHLVTVVMPVHRPDAGLLTSVRSIAAQTWPDLEIILVDDASGPEFAELFDRAVGLDPRVRLLRLARNGGTYLARNAALSEAAGEFVTFQDADDWSHPQRVERQLRLLLDRPQVPACLSRSVRARPDLTHQWFGYRAVRDNAPSLMVRRAVLDRIGAFTAVRKGGDSEFTERVATLLGRVAVEPSPLAVYRLRAGSLSRADFRYQWAAPERLAFRGSYRAWHRTLAPGHGAPVISSEPPFPVPRSYRATHAARTGPGSAPPRVDLVLAGDFSLPPGSGPDVELGSSTDPGPEVALWHLEVPDAAGPERPEMHPAWFDEAVARPGRIHLVARTEPLRTPLLVVLDPRVLLLQGDQDCAVAADRVEVRLAPQHAAPDGTGLPVDLLGVAEVCRSWWGSAPSWTFAPNLSPAERADLAAAFPGLDLAEPSDPSASAVASVG